MFVGKGIVEKNKSDILPGSGVDTQRFLPVEHKGEAENFVFLFVARMLWDKGVGEYIEASKIIKDKYTNVEFQMLGFLDVENFPRRFQSILLALFIIPSCFCSRALSGKLPTGLLCLAWESFSL